MVEEEEGGLLGAESVSAELMGGDREGGRSASEQVDRLEGRWD